MMEIPSLVRARNLWDSLYGLIPEKWKSYVALAPRDKIIEIMAKHLATAYLAGKDYENERIKKRIFG